MTRLKHYLLITFLYNFTVKNILFRNFNQFGYNVNISLRNAVSEI